MPRLWFNLLLALVIFLLFGLALSGLEQDSLWLDEAWTAWTIHDEMRPPESPREVARFILTSFDNTVEKVRNDVHLPLYFLLLDGWALLVGDSQFALRLPSTLMGILALAATYSIGAIWFNRRTAIIALLLLGTNGFFIYYCRDARMYTLLLALATLATVAYSRWWQHPTIWHSVLYSVLMTLALYTHYVSGLVLLAHLLHLLITWRKNRVSLVKLVLPLILIGSGYAFWVGFALAQYQAHPGGVLAEFLPTNWHTIKQIALLFTAGYIVNFVLPFVLSRIVPDTLSKRSDYQAITLLLLWLCVPIMVLLLINARGFAIFQMRYIIVTVPAWLLLVAAAIDRTRFLRLPNSATLQTLTQIFLVALLIYTQMTTYAHFWPAKPRWREAVIRTSEARSTLEPALMLIPAQSPAAYYDRFYPIYDGITHDIGWQRLPPDEITRITDYVTDNESVWAMLMMQDPQSWDAIALLSAKYGAGYRDSVQGTIFYRFDVASDDAVNFQFGTDDNSPIPISWQYETYQIGQTVCSDTFVRPNNSYTVELSLVRDYDDIISTTTDTCLNIPDENGILHLRLSLLNAGGNRLPLVETGQYWGDYLVIGSLQVRR